MYFSHLLAKNCFTLFSSFSFLSSSDNFKDLLNLEIIFLKSTFPKDVISFFSVI